MAGDEGGGGGTWFSLLLVVGVTLLCGSASSLDTAEYWQERELLLAQEQTMILGQEQVLTADEQQVNDLLMTHKMNEMNNGFQTLEFLPAFNFMTIIPQMEASEVFRTIKQMPKGAALHLHDTAMTSASWLVDNITYMPDLYMCFVDDQLYMKFFETPDASCDWLLVSDERKNAMTEEEFNQMIFSQISLWTDKPDEAYPDINTAWVEFQKRFTAITDMLMYRPAWEQNLYQALTEMMEDNILYVEFRGTLPPLYELNGTVLSLNASLAVYRDTAERFLTDHPNDYFGTRFIYAPPKKVDNATFEGYITSVRQFKQLFPDFLAGFDLVGQEDSGRPLKEVIDYLLQITEEGIPVFYHAGETNWMGMSTDENLVDAILLNASRIGHGYAITKHPELKQLVLSRDVALEVCPISNQVLKLVDDLRNHPAAGLVAEGFPLLVVSADDPGLWGAKGISYDFYEAFMALGGAKADLRFLKQLAINSIRYSSLEEEAKTELMTKWNAKWDEFVASSKKRHNPIFPHPTTLNGTATNTSTLRMPANITERVSDNDVAPKNVSVPLRTQERQKMPKSKLFPNL